MEQMMIVTIGDSAAMWLNPDGWGGSVTYEFEGGEGGVIESEDQTRELVEAKEKLEEATEQLKQLIRITIL